MIVYTTLDRGSVSYDVRAVIYERSVAESYDIGPERAHLFPGWFIDIVAVSEDKPGGLLIETTEEEDAYITKLALKQLQSRICED